MTFMIDDTADLWWKNAIFYCLDVETFLDGNGDGCGDFNGLTQRVDYLADGVTCLWLMPFQPSPNRDDAMTSLTIMPWTRVSARLGTSSSSFTARDRGLRVIADLVVNHTSRQHPWFQAARAEASIGVSRLLCRRDEPPEESPKDLVFPDKEDSRWEWDEKAGQYFLHQFYKRISPISISSTRRCAKRSPGSPASGCSSGSRGSASMPCRSSSKPGTRQDPDLDPHKFLRDLQAFLDARWVTPSCSARSISSPSSSARFFGDEDGDELHMCLNFNINQAMALALVREEAAPLVGPCARSPRSGGRTVGKLRAEP